MIRRVLPRLTAVPLLVGILYWVAATTSLWLTSGTDGVASMWPASGVLLAAVIRTSGRTKVACIVAAAAASAAANLIAGMSPTVSAGFTIANVLEALAGGWIWNRLSDGRRELSSWVDVLRLATSVIGAACVSAVVAAATLGRPSALFVLSWFCTVALGMLLVTPVVMTDERFLDAEAAKPDVARRTWWLGALAVVTVASFAQAGYPLLFLPLAILLGVTWHVGLKGSASGLLLISLVGSVCTDLGRGPLALMDVGPEMRSLFFQAYLLTLFATALPLAVISSSRARLTARLVQAVQAAEEAARISLELADRDALTGVASRRRVMEDLTAAVLDANVRGSPLSVILLDIDHFKRINDTWGHAEGDAVLCGLAGLLEEAAGPVDVVGRVGGEEFMVVTPKERDAATELAQLLQRRFTDQPLGESGISVSASFGVAGHQRGEDVKGLIRRADRALYQAKEAGRDMVWTSSCRI